MHATPRTKTEEPWITFEGVSLLGVRPGTLKDMGRFLSKLKHVAPVSASLPAGVSEAPGSRECPSTAAGKIQHFQKAEELG